MKKQVVELVFIFVFTFLYCIFCSKIQMDEIWSFGFSYNLANGLIPYTDYNMVIGPFFPLFNGLLLLIFGNNMLIYNIIGTFIGTLIFYFMKKIHPRSCYISYALLLLVSFYGYNIFTLFLLYILIYLEKNSKSDYLIGIVIGIAILTKLSIGVFLAIPTLFIKNINKIIKRTLGAEIVILLSFLIMLLIGNFSDFLNYTVLGLFEFGDRNAHFSWWIMVTILSIITLLYFYFIKKDKDINIIYLFCFQIMAYPIFDFNHCLLAMIPVLGYSLNKLKLDYKITLISFVIFMAIMLTHNYIKIKNNEFVFDTNSILFKYRLIGIPTYEGLNTMNDYIKSKEEDYRVFVFERFAYIYKIEANKPIDKFDLIYDGNMGYNGSVTYINDIDNICKEQKCLFLIDYKDFDFSYSQTNQEILTYVVDNYSKIDNLYFYEIYGDSNE